MVRLAAPFVGLAALLASPALAQSSPPAQQTPSRPNRAASDVEAGAEWFGVGNEIYSVGTECAKISFELKGLDKEAAAAERLNEGFGKFGHVLTGVTAGAQAAQGNYADATQTVAEAYLDHVVCEIWSGPLCLSWTAGRMAGAVIKKMPMPLDSQHRTIEEAVLDSQVGFAQYLIPSLNQPMNIENMRAAFDAFQAQRRALLNARDRARSAAGQCKMNGDRAGSDGPASESTLGDRAMARFRQMGGNPYQSDSSDAAAWNTGQQSAPAAPAYSPPPAQQQRSSNSGFDFGLAVGAALTGYAVGQANNANQRSSTSTPSASPNASTNPQSSQDQCRQSELPEGMVCTAN